MASFQELGHDVDVLLRPLLDYLAVATGEVASGWRDWRIETIHGGTNNRLYRTTNPFGSFVVKFTIRDSRNRAGREYNALLALQQVAPSIAPRPVFLDTDSYAQPVVVQTWLEGAVSTKPPEANAEWMHLIHHYVTVHSVVPGMVDVHLAPAVLNANSVGACSELVRDQLALVPTESQPAILQAILRSLEQDSLLRWLEPRLALCRVDANILNFVRRPDRWASVDWENSGWGDPAFELAELLAHPAYVDVFPSRWRWVVSVYCQLSRDQGSALRIRVYYKTMVGWWVARLARALYEIPQGLDQRLVTRPPGWQADLQAKYQHYLGIAETLI